MPENRVSTYESESGASLTIKVKGSFDMNVVSDFRRSYEDQMLHYKSYAVDLKNCTGITSAGLGMLLVLRDFAKVKKENLLIINCSQSTHDKLNLAGFAEIFTIQ